MAGTASESPAHGAFAALRQCSWNDRDLAFFWDRSNVASAWAGRELFRLHREAWA